ncbi:AraC family transcriptional regulator [Nostoc sp.]|uniref:AraC family transcriptional regulator n=1 Tax=Nostoc sp. TaxID=1180 RepID=UPI002FF50DF2
MSLDIARTIAQTEYDALWEEADECGEVCWQFHQLFGKQKLSSSNLSFRPRDAEKLHLAKAILERSLEHPPSLLELAKLVGLNDFKLKQGFRHLFGTTVFGYLRTCRMQQAQQLLRDRVSSGQQLLILCNPQEQTSVAQQQLLIRQQKITLIRNRQKVDEAKVKLAIAQKEVKELAKLQQLEMQKQQLTLARNRQKNAYKVLYLGYDGIFI